MDSNSLKYFIVTARVQHMTRAAQQLNITQPTLSASIRRLEAELGFQLFDRGGRGIQLNEYGKIFLAGAEEAERALNESLARMAELRQGSSGFVRIACAISPTNSRLIDLLLGKGLSLKVSEVPDDWERQLMEDECDLVITFGRPKGSGVESALLRYQKLAIVASREHPLAGRERVTAEDLRSYPFCSTSAPHSIINMAADALRDYGLTPRITFLGRNSADMVKAITSGTRLGVMVERNLPENAALQVLPAEGFDVSLPIFLYWRRGGNRSSAMTLIQQNIIRFYQG